MRSVVRVNQLLQFGHSYKNSYYVIITEKHDQSGDLNASFNLESSRTNFIYVKILFAGLTFVELNDAFGSENKPAQWL